MTAQQFDHSHNSHGDHQRAHHDDIDTDKAQKLTKEEESSSSNHPNTRCGDICNKGSPIHDGNQADTSLDNNNCSPNQFRPDVCEKETMKLFYQDQLRARARIQMMEWQRTVASKKDHEIFLKMLVVEAHRQNASHVSAERRNVLLAAISDAFHSKSKDADPYLSTLQLITSGRLFEGTSPLLPADSCRVFCEDTVNADGNDFGINEYSLL